MISKTLPAVKVGSNGSKCFFNQIIAAYTGWVDKRNEYGKAVVFGDGTPLPKETIEDLAKFMLDNQCAYRWENGQFCIVDNSMAYHSRQPFKGRRICYASIGLNTKPVTTNQTHLVLKSGDKMPSVGLGCWKIPKENCADTVYNSIKAGYRCIDEACDYGNEKEAGEGLARAI